MIRRPPRSTQSRSSAASDVYKRQPGSRPASRRRYPFRGRWSWWSRRGIPATLFPPLKMGWLSLINRVGSGCTPARFHTLPASFRWGSWAQRSRGIQAQRLAQQIDHTYVHAGYLAAPKVKGHAVGFLVVHGVGIRRLDGRSDSGLKPDNLLLPV